MTCQEFGLSRFNYSRLTVLMSDNSLKNMTTDRLSDEEITQ
ncbi:14120_t:CDS:1, partial [Rhizophagus irregularis]